MSQRRFTLLVLVLLAVGCMIHLGAAKTAQCQAARIKGKALDLAGKPLRNVHVMAMHRAEHTEHEAVTNKNGTFVLEVTSGAYDISAMLKGYDLHYMGPVIVSVSETIYLVMSPVGQKDNGLVYGGITNKSGGKVPKGTTVKLVPNEGLKDSALLQLGPSRQAAMKADGTFHFSDVPESYLNLVVSVPGKKDEAIDFVKLDGPCRLDFRVGTPYPNEWQPGMNVEGTPSQFLAVNESSLGSGSCTVVPERPIRVNGQSYLVLGCGTAKYGSTESVSELDTGNPCPIACWEITVAKNGVWWYKYAINIYNTVFTTSSGWINYIFTDGEPDIYTLRNFRQGRHKVSYNSKSPDIHSISYTWSD